MMSVRQFDMEVRQRGATPSWRSVCQRAGVGGGGGGEGPGSGRGRNRIDP